MTILLSDPRVAAVPLVECGEPLVRLDPSFGPAGARVRTGLALRLRRAQEALPAGIGLRVVEGHRSVADQRAIIARYAAEVAAAHPTADAAERHHLTSRFVSPVEVAPHVAGAAVDLTLVDLRRRDGDRRPGVELDLGTPIDATPEQSGGRCFTDATAISHRARAHRALLAAVLTPVGLVNYPTEWWHWSHGDRYWALLTEAEAAPYGPVGLRAGVAA
ncbi:MAG TPA: M15 family metallopeptidase [Nocardioides sp.]